MGIQEGKEVRLKHLLPVLPEADPGVQGGIRHHRHRQGWHHHCPRPKKAFEGIGRPISDGEANNMVGEAPGPINFTQMVISFAEKMSGGTDDDDVIVRSFEAFEINGQIDAEMFRHSLMTWGEKFSSNEIDDAFREFKIDGGMIDAEHLKSILIAKKTLLVIKYPFESRHQHLSTTNCWGRAKKAPEKLVYQKCIRIRADKRNIKGILICESTKRKYLSVAIVNECK